MEHTGELTGRQDLAGRLLAAVAHIYVEVQSDILHTEELAEVGDSNTHEDIDVLTTAEDLADTEDWQTRFG